MHLEMQLLLFMSSDLCLNLRVQGLEEFLLGRITGANQIGFLMQGSSDSVHQLNFSALEQIQGLNICHSVNILHQHLTLLWAIVKTHFCNQLVDGVVLGFFFMLVCLLVLGLQGFFFFFFLMANNFSFLYFPWFLSQQDFNVQLLGKYRLHIRSNFQ